MKTILIEKLPRIIKNKSRLEKSLKIKITNRGKEVSFDGKAEDEFVAEQVFDALNFGFPYSTAMLIKDEEFMFEILNIKSYVKRKDSEHLKRTKARIIGTKGKTLATLSSLTNCFFELKENEVGIIGDSMYIKNAQDAIISLIKGTKTSNVYAYLEKHQPLKFDNLDLKR